VSFEDKIILIKSLLECKRFSATVKGIS